MLSAGPIHQQPGQRLAARHDGPNARHHQTRRVWPTAFRQHEDECEPVALRKQGDTGSVVRSINLRCADLYERAGIDLTTEPLVGVGSVCRRQATAQIELLIHSLHARGITRLHGFGVKTQGLIRCGRLLASADSMAWSYAARRQPPLPGCETRHINCANCPRYAYAWHARIAASLTRQPCVQLPLFGICGGDAP